MAKKKIFCDSCNNECTIVYKDTEDQIEFCPFCGEPVLGDWCVDDVVED